MNNNEKNSESNRSQRVLWVLLSLIPLLGGLGLIVAGVKEQRKWLWTGIVYIALEWILVLNMAGTLLIIASYVVPIVHTIEVCRSVSKQR